MLFPFSLDLVATKSGPVWSRSCLKPRLPLARVHMADAPELPPAVCRLPTHCSAVSLQCPFAVHTQHYIFRLFYVYLCGSGTDAPRTAVTCVLTVMSVGCLPVSQSPCRVIHSFPFAVLALSLFILLVPLTVCCERARHCPLVHLRRVLFRVLGDFPGPSFFWIPRRALRVLFDTPSAHLQYHFQCIVYCILAVV